MERGSRETKVDPYELGKCHSFHVFTGVRAPASSRPESGSATNGGGCLPATDDAATTDVGCIFCEVVVPRR